MARNRVARTIDWPTFALAMLVQVIVIGLACFGFWRAGWWL